MHFLYEHQNGKLKCPYKGCEKEFDQPNMITDSSIPRQTHYTCPHCITKINIITKGTRIVGVLATEHPKVFNSPASSMRASETGSDNERPLSVGLGNDRQEANKEKTGQSPQFQCSYHFGYLSEKDKGEVVPEACFGCPKSLDCMLSELNNSQQSLQEIKKWYSF
jgi:DNA-directed RNA polymerase subunit RPC12/RpoP